MAIIPERFNWAVELLNIRSSDKILEIGCGTGILAELIANYLTTGKLTAIDKSVPMIEKAKKRNRENIAKDIVQFIASDFLNATLPGSNFDCIVSFNINFFWKDPKEELQLIKRILKKNGKLFIFYQAPFEITISSANPVKKKLLENSFEVSDIRLKKFSPTSAICIISKLS